MPTEQFVGRAAIEHAAKSDKDLPSLGPQAVRND